MEHAPPGTEPFSSNLALIEGVIKLVARRHRLSPDDAEDFAGTVCLRLLENNCAVLRKFQGRSAFRTFLVVVIQRMLLDYRIGRWGKWRASTEAKRLGPVAVGLEKLTTRDRFSFAEASETLRTNGRVPLSECELEDLMSRLPARPRRRMVGESELENRVASTVPADVNLLSSHAAWTIGALARAVASLDADDRTLLRLRFADCMRMADIARRRMLDQKSLYRRFERVLRRLRADLQKQGIAADDVRGWIGRLEMDEEKPGVFESTALGLRSHDQDEAAAAVQSR